MRHKISEKRDEGRRETRGGRRITTGHNRQWTGDERWKMRWEMRDERQEARVGIYFCQRDSETWNKIWIFERIFKNSWNSSISLSPTPGKAKIVGGKPIKTSLPRTKAGLISHNGLYKMYIQPTPVMQGLSLYWRGGAEWRYTGGRGGILPESPRQNSII